MWVLYFFQLAGIQLSKKKHFNQATVSFAFITSGTEGIFTGATGGFTGTTGFSGDSLGFLGLSLEVSMVVSCITKKCHDFRVTKNNSTAHGLCTKVFRQKHLKILYQIYWKLIHRHYCKCCIVHVWRVQWSSWLRCSPSLQTHPVLALHPSPWP